MTTSAQSFTTFTQEENVTYITWQLSTIFREIFQELHPECPNGESVNDSNLHLKIVSSENQENEEEQMKLYFSSRNEVHINYLKCIHQKIFNKLEMNTYDLDYNSIIQPNMWLYIGTLEKWINSVIKLQISTSVNEKKDPFCILESLLCNDFKNLLLHCGSDSDAIMKSTDGDEYKVHKDLLTNRSPVLKAHFEQNTTESVTNIVESPLESEVLYEVITFIYTDRAPNVAKIPEKLLAAAHFYQLDRLKGLSEEALSKNLTADNALDTLQLAELYSCENLKKSTLKFIKDEAQLVTKTEAWAKMNSLELIKNIFEHATNENN